MMADFGLQLAQIPDFTIQGPDAGAMALDGFYAGQGNVRAQQAMGLAQNADGRAQVQQGMDQQRLAIDQQDAGMRQTAFTQAQQDRVAMVTRAKEAQAAFGALYDKIDDGTATAGDIAQVTSAYPELSDGIKQTVDGMAQEQKAAYTSLIFQAATALKLGKPEVAAKLFEDHATAAENSNQTDAAAIARAMAETAKADPAAALGTLGIFAQSIDPAINAAVFGEAPEWRAMTPDEAKARGMVGGQMNDKTGEAKSAPTASTIVNVGNTEKAAARADAKVAATDTIVNAAQKARELIGMGSTGLIGQAMSTISATNAAEIVRQVNVLKANASSENIQAMRNASPTGGALGAVSDRDIQLLADKSGAIDPFSGQDRFAAQLDDYEQTLLRIVHGVADGDAIFASTRSASGAAGGPGSPVPAAGAAGVPSKERADELLRGAP